MCCKKCSDLVIFVSFVIKTACKYSKINVFCIFISLSNSAFSLSKFNFRYQMKQITVFEHINEVKNPYYINVEHALQRIKNGKSKVSVEKIRKEKDAAKRSKLKNNLPCICYSGKFRQRKKSEIIEHTGFVCLDFDKVENVEVKKAELAADKYVFSCWVSPSGNGVKALIKIPSDIEKHEMYFDSLKTQYPDIDPSGRDVGRVCFESYDPLIYINQTS